MENTFLPTRFFWFLLAGILLVAQSINAQPSRQPATGTLFVNLGAGVVVPGGRVFLPLTVEAGPACGGLQGEIAWNPAALRLVSTRAGRAGLVLGVADTVSGHLPLLWTDPAGQPLRGPVVLVEIEFAGVAAPTATTMVDLVDGPRTALLALDSVLAPLTLHVSPASVLLGTVGLANSSLVTRHSALHIWPNPARGAVQILGEPGAAVALLDGLGHVVRTAMLDLFGNGRVALAGLPAGMYMLRTGAAIQRLAVE